MGVDASTDAESTGGEQPSLGASRVMEALDELAVALRARLVERARDGGAGGSLESEVRKLVEAEAAPLPEADRDELAARVVLLATGLGPLEPLLADPSVDEVMVNGPGRSTSSAAAASNERRSSSPGRRS